MFHFDAEFTRVVLRFAPSAAATAREFEFHPKEDVVEEEDGSLLVSFESSGLVEMAWHLAKWGNAVEVVEPQALREMAAGFRNASVRVLPGCVISPGKGGAGAGVVMGGRTKPLRGNGARGWRSASRSASFFVLGLSGLTIGVFPPVRQEVAMKEEKTTPLRQRMIEDMHIRGLCEKTLQGHIRCVKHFAAFLRRSPDTATPDDLRAYQLRMTKDLVSATTFNVRIISLRLFFSVTCDRLRTKRRRPE